MKIIFSLFVLGSALFVRAQNIGIGTTSPKARLHVIDSNVLFSADDNIPDIQHTGNPPIQGPGRRMMWFPNRAAFRVGYVDNKQWDDHNIGNYSFAAGYDVMATGPVATAIGMQTLAGNTAATAMGIGTTSLGSGSTTMGKNTFADGNSSIASGSFSSATGGNSFAMGEGTLAASFDCVSLGRYNYTTPTSGTTWVATDPVLIVGNGLSNSNPSNILEFYKTGNMGIKGGYYQFSDKQLKKDIIPIGDGLQKILQLEGYHFRWKDSLLDQKQQTGILAQEVEQAMPELVQKSLKGDLMVNYNGLVPYLIEAVKELQKEIDELKKQLKNAPHK